MTATADIVVKQVNNAVLVPNSALRFAPPPQETKSTRTAGGSLLSKLFPRPVRTGQNKNAGNGDKKRQRLWILRDNQPVAVPVTTGATDGIMTEITSGEVSPGMPVIIEAVSKEK
jgi:HlyD family secretion protein